MFRNGISFLCRLSHVKRIAFVMKYITIFATFFKFCFGLEIAFANTGYDGLKVENQIFLGVSHGGVVFIMF